MNYSIKKIKNALQNGDIKDIRQKQVAESIVEIYEDDEAMAIKSAKQFLELNNLKKDKFEKIENALTIDFYDIETKQYILSVERGSNKISLSSQLFKNNAEFGDYVAILSEILTKLN